MNAKESQLIEQLFLEMYDMLICYACSSLKEEPLAEEAVQETFQLACLRADKLLASKNPQGWIVNALKYTLANMIRSRENSRLILSKYLATQSETIVFSEDKVRLEILYQNVADMEEFQLVKEMVIDGRSHLEIASDRGITLAACRKRVQRARETLQKKLKY